MAGESEAKGKVVVVTGGCGGLGVALVKEFKKAGSSVVCKAVSLLKHFLRSLFLKFAS